MNAQAHWAREPQLSKLPPILRVLLVTDGTVTRTLEAYFAEAIEVHVLTHATLSSDRYHPQIEVVPGDPILRRRVVLKGKASGSAYVYAESIISCNRLSPEIGRRLMDERIGIGELLCKGRIETHRELLSVRQEQVGELDRHLDVDRKAWVYVRNYNIHCQGCAAITISEAFPQSRYTAG